MKLAIVFMDTLLLHAYRLGSGHTGVDMKRQAQQVRVNTVPVPDSGSGRSRRR